MSWARTPYVSPQMNRDPPFSISLTTAPGLLLVTLRGATEIRETGALPLKGSSQRGLSRAGRTRQCPSDPFRPCLPLLRNHPTLLSPSEKTQLVTASLTVSKVQVLSLPSPPQVWKLVPLLPSTHFIHPRSFINHLIKTHLLVSPT